VKVLTVALGGGMAGRLFTELRDKQALAYSTGALNPSRVQPSVLIAYLGTAPDNAERAEEGMRRELDRIVREPVSPDELARAKAYLLGQFALDRRTNARLAWYQAFFESAGVGHDFARRYVRAVEAVTADDLQRVAQSYLAAPTFVSLRPAAR
jgi:zinc protease